MYGWLVESAVGAFFLGVRSSYMVTLVGRWTARVLDCERSSVVWRVIFDAKMDWIPRA